MTRALGRRRAPGKHSRTAPPVAPPAPQGWRPDVAGARVLRRARQARPEPQGWQPQPQARAQWFPPHPWEATGAMVRPYVAHLGKAPRNARTGAQGDPWGRVQ
ncbi:hypothetical protein AB0I77_49210 [Streptomyces sp. NPDC050619]|uniref:hypothetical protein n=1 Tax=Streptomyces sp. NPDC050619 TaxID=3157214 RepID=UPI00343B168B